jgi:hypothetical protein
MDHRPLKLILLSDSWVTVTGAAADHSDKRFAPVFSAAVAPAVGSARHKRTTTAIAVVIRVRVRLRGDRAWRRPSSVGGRRSRVENMDEGLLSATRLTA